MHVWCLSIVRIRRRLSVYFNLIVDLLLIVRTLRVCVSSLSPTEIMALLVSIPSDILRLIFGKLSLDDLASLARTCRALRNAPYMIRSLELPAHLLVVRPNRVEIHKPSYKCMAAEEERCDYSGSEKNFGYCSGCVKIYTDPALRERSRAAWVARTKEEEERKRRVCIS